MKFLLLIPDGMADWRIEKLGNRTPLEVAEKPNMDFIAKEGSCGSALTVPKGFEPGSDVANLTILGIDVRKYYTGRGPIEALANGIKARLVFRCNLVRVSDIMLDYAGGRISDSEAKKVIEHLNANKKIDFITFYPGRSYRNLLAIEKEFDDVKTFPPHDIQGKKISEYMPKGGKLADLLCELMEWSKEILPAITEKANMIWLWGGGKIPAFPKFKEKFRMSGAMISEVDLLKGIAKGLEMEFIEVEGLTGYVDTNYRGLVRGTLKSLEKFDFVALHTEGIDEVSHEGNLEGKIEAIEIYDEKIIGKILDKADLSELKILMLPDHPTPIELRTHVAENVPFAIYGYEKDEVKTFSEFACAKGRYGSIDGLKLMDYFLRRSSA
ncbi:MAG: cofactor-independent phosphoglycerate mutase [Archaeoglobaceae archaeon]|nr:cofactor-independent phosphoglycerate mutase [Archaeoglobaceae archaeon]MDW8118680.1 cofactor-independent phosphoglycerate mutase [Archaeoglobaceae archaeon]